MGSGHKANTWIQPWHTNNEGMGDFVLSESDLAKETRDTVNTSNLLYRANN